MDLNWEAIGAIGELTGASAVVISLIYLATQIRQNTKASRAQSYLAVIEGHVSHHRTLNAHPELIGIFARGMRNYMGLNELEQAQFHSFIAPIVLEFQKYLYLHNARLLPDNTFDMFEKDVVATLITPGGYDWWQESKGKWPEVSDYLDRRMVELNGDVVPSHEDFGGFSSRIGKDSHDA